MLAHHDAKLLPGRGRARGRVVGRGELGVGVGGHFVLRIQARHGVIAHTAQVLLQRAAEELDAPELEHALQHRGVRAHLAAVGRRRILQNVDTRSHGNIPSREHHLANHSEEPLLLVVLCRHRVRVHLCECVSAWVRVSTYL